MELSETEHTKAAHFFQKKNIQPEEIKSFRFMGNHYCKGQYSPETKIGASILTLQLEKKEKVFRLKKDQTAILRFLLSKGITFSNYTPQKRNEGRITEKTYKSIANIAFWFCATAMVTLLATAALNAVFDGNTIYQYKWMRETMFFILIPSCLFCAILFWNALLFQCNYVQVTSEALILKGIVFETILPYKHIRKVNFSQDFSKQPSPILELMDKDYRYRKYALRGTAFKAIDEITKTLRAAGIDATNSNR